MGCIKSNGIDRGTHKKRLGHGKEISLSGAMPKAGTCLRQQSPVLCAAKLSSCFLVGENALEIKLQGMTNIQECWTSLRVNQSCARLGILRICALAPAVLR